MSSKRNILFLSSDPRSNGKSRWQAELRDIREALKMAKERDKFELKEHFAVRPRDLRRSLQEDKPSILHISGKNDGEGILLEASNGEPKPVSPSALSELLALFVKNPNHPQKKGLEWVILSGCFQENQASAVSEVVPYLIGMDHVLAPEIRTAAAVAIYDAIGAGESDPQRILGFARSAIMLQQGNGDQIHLYVAGEEVKEGQPPSLPTERVIELPDLEEAINRSEVYQCDRTSQGDRFRNEYENNSEGQFHFFAIHGEDPQSHHGLFKRFYYRFLHDFIEPDLTKEYKVPLPEMNSLEGYQGVIRERLLTTMEMGRVLRKPDLEEMTEVGRKLSKLGVESVAVEFRVRSSHWKTFIPELIDWFVNTYCQYHGDSDFYPVFYFFVSIIYENEADHELSLTEIRSLVPRLPHCHVLTELAPVNKSDVLAWIDEYISSNSLRKQRLWNRYFPEDRAQYDMVEVEQRLNTLINRETPDGNR